MFNPAKHFYYTLQANFIIPISKLFTYCHITRYGAAAKWNKYEDLPPWLDSWLASFLAGSAKLVPSGNSVKLTFPFKLSVYSHSHAPTLLGINIIFRGLSKLALGMNYVQVLGIN